MNIKLISEIAMLGLMGTFKIGNYIADEKFEKVKALELAVAENPSDDLAKYMKAKNDITLRDTVLSREGKALKAAIKEWKRTSGFDSKKNAFYADGTRALEEFKKSLDYDAKLAEIQKDMEDSIAAFKVSVNYDETVEALDREIADATEKWEIQRKMYENVDETISEDAAKLKHIAEDTKNKIVSEAKSKKEVLEKQLAAEKEKFDRKRRDSVRVMEEKIAKEKRRLDEKTARNVDSLEREFDEAKAKMLHDIQAQRTEEEADCILMAHDNEELVRLQDANDYSRSLSIASDTPAAEKLAWWLKEHGWTKGCVIFVGALPVIPAGYLAYRYGKFVLDVASKV